MKPPHWSLHVSLIMCPLCLLFSHWIMRREKFTLSTLKAPTLTQTPVSPTWGLLRIPRHWEWLWGMWMSLQSFPWTTTFWTCMKTHLWAPRWALWQLWILTVQTAVSGKRNNVCVCVCTLNYLGPTNTDISLLKLLTACWDSHTAAGTLWWFPWWPALSLAWHIEVTVLWSCLWINQRLKPSQSFEGSFTCYCFAFCWDLSK